MLWITRKTIRINRSATARGGGAMIRATVVAIVVLLGCKASGRDVVVYTSVDQPFSQPVFDAFEKHTGIHVRAVYDTEETKSTGVVNRLIAEAKSPQADVFWANDPVRPFLLVDRGMVEPYLAPNAAGIPAPFKAADGTWTGFAARARILLVNTKKVVPAEMPRSIKDLADPRWKGQTAIANPLFGTTTMHVAALFAAWGDQRAQTFIQDMKTNDVRVASSNGEVKRLVATGEVAFGLTDTDDAHEAVEEGAPVEVVYPDQDGDGTPIMPTVVVLLQGSPHADTGRQLIDYLLSADVEDAMAAKAAHMPLRSGVAVPKGVRPVGELRAFSIDYPRVAKTMERIEPVLRTWAGI
jgi:iron(III) transport system substrate-binding protein